MTHLPKTLLAFTITSLLSACSIMSSDKPMVQSNDEGSINNAYTQQSIKNSANQLITNDEMQQQNQALNGGAGFSTKYRQLLKQNQRRDQLITTLEDHQKNITKQTPASKQDLNFYVRRLMQDLVNNLQFVNDRTPVAVTDFVLLDSDLQTTNLLGYQITESLTHEIHKFGIPVIDYKSTGYIRVTEEGDFLLTRNYEEIAGNLPIRYVFTGTLTKHEKGYLVNAKVVGVESRAIVGSAQSFIPNEVSEALISTQPIDAPDIRSSVSLVQG